MTRYVNGTGVNLAYPVPDTNRIVHANVTCDGCGTVPITGPRFKYARSSSSPPPTFPHAYVQWRMVEAESTLPLNCV